MGQILIRNLDDDLIADYREAAKRHDRSLEAQVRETLRLHRPLSTHRQQVLKARLAEIRAMTPKGVKQTPSEDIVREMRDGDRW